MAVYFIRAGENGPIKIGFTNSIQSRLSKIATDCPPPVELIGFIERAPIEAERALHRRFAAHRIDREWFKPAPELLGFAREHAPIPKDDGPKWDTPLGRWIHERDISPAQLARMLGTTQAHVSRFLTDTSRPTWKFLERIAEVTDGAVMPNDFLRWKARA
jgi:hypothetical protein